MVYKKNPKFLNQIQYCERESIPIMVVIGEEEKVQGGVKIRDVQTQKEVYITSIFIWRKGGGTVHVCSTTYFLLTPSINVVVPFAEVL